MAAASASDLPGVAFDGVGERDPQILAGDQLLQGGLQLGDVLVDIPDVGDHALCPSSVAIRQLSEAHHFDLKLTAADHDLTASQ